MFRSYLIMGLILAISPQVIAGQRPFWTEKSSYSEGDRIYFVGVASNTITVEEGRKRAMEAAIQELSAYLRSTNASTLHLETQMTFEEPTQKGFNVFRLVWITRLEVAEFKKKQLEEEANAMKAEHQKIGAEIKRNGELLASIEQQNSEIEEQHKALAIAERRISRVSKNARKSLLCGMTIEEANAVMGSDRASSREECGPRSNILYGVNWYSFRNGVLQCKIPLNRYSRCNQSYQCTQDACPGLR